MQFNPIETFLLEAEDLLTGIEEAALQLSGDSPSQESVHRLFRAFHTLKGSGGMCGLDGVAGFTHHVETLLDRVRSGEVPVSPELIAIVLASRDHIKAMLAAEQGLETVAAGTGEALIARIARLLEEAGGSPETPAGSRDGGAPSGTAPAPAPGSAPGDAAARTWTIRFRPDPGLLASGGNPVILLRDLRELGDCEVEAHSDDVPPLGAIQPDACYFWWTIKLRTSADENAIKDVFIFVEDGATLEIEPDGPADAPVAAPAAAVASIEVPAATVAAPGTGMAAPAAGIAALPATAAEGNKHRPPPVASTVRVPSARLDRLVNLVGELVMNQSRLSQVVSQGAAPELVNPVQELERLIAELRDDVLEIRMLPIGTIFGRFRRLVHDLALELGKDVDLITEGAETELDKSILDQLGEPLVHLIRNSLDHGIEPAADRVARNKPPRGTIRLAAVHTGSDVVVSIEDDGRGIDRAAVRAKAVEKHLIAADAVLSDKEMLNLILLPGFSTAREVTSVSGRGVGMDVVKRQIDLLRGHLRISSVEGKGSRLALTLPLTLAIIEGLLVRVGGDGLIIPMAAVTENVELERAQRERNNGRNVVTVRGELVPYIDLRRVFSIPGTAPALEKIVIVRHDDQRVGLVVDQVVGAHQTVIQSLGRSFRKIEVVSGATVMGDGRVALILDIAAVVRCAGRETLETHLAASAA
jgi:two-component system, chemotaxis family, sensor kinase CheA